MKVWELIPGMTFRHPSVGAVTFIAQTSHPYYSHLRLVIWRMHDSDELSLDALSWAQDVGNPEPGNPEVWRTNVREAIGISVSRDIQEKR